MRNQRIWKVLVLPCLLLLFGSCSSKRDMLYGYWSIDSINAGDSVYNYASPDLFLPSMTVLRRPRVLMLPIGDRPNYGVPFRYVSASDSCDVCIEVYDSSFDGIYCLTLKDSVLFDTPVSKRVLYSLYMKGEDLEIIAYREGLWLK